MDLKLTYYKDNAGKWRWRMKGGNNEIYQTSHQGFATRGGAVRNFNLGRGYNSIRANRD